MLNNIVLLTVINGHFGDLGQAESFTGLKLAYCTEIDGNTMKKRTTLLLLLVASFCLTGSIAQGQEGKVNSGDPPEEKKPNAGAVHNAALGYQLALLGDSNKSSTMMLAAAELLGGMKQSDKDAKLEKSSTKSEGGNKTVQDMSFGAMLDRAVEYSSAKEKEYVQSKVDELRSGRGLAWSQGKNKESVNIGGTTYKILDHEVIYPGQTITYSDLIFEGGKPASIVAIGDGDGDLDLWIYDGGGNKNQIDKDTDGTSRCVTDWHPKWDGPFTARVKNVGRVTEEFLIIANW